jgi:hypothetical protein
MIESSVRRLRRDFALTEFNAAAIKIHLDLEIFRAKMVNIIRNLVYVARFVPLRTRYPADDLSSSRNQ